MWASTQGCEVAGNGPRSGMPRTEHTPCRFERLEADPGRLLQGVLAPLLPELPPVLSSGTWRILLVTSMGLGLSFTPLRRIPGSHLLAMALVYLFVRHNNLTALPTELGQLEALRTLCSVF